MSVCLLEGSPLPSECIRFERAPGDGSDCRSAWRYSALHTGLGLRILYDTLSTWASRRYTLLIDRLPVYETTTTLTPRYHTFRKTDLLLRDGNDSGFPLRYSLELTWTKHSHITSQRRADFDSVHPSTFAYPRSSTRRRTTEASCQQPYRFNVIPVFYYWCINRGLQLALLLASKSSEYFRQSSTSYITLDTNPGRLGLKGTDFCFLFHPSYPTLGSLGH